MSDLPKGWAEPSLGDLCRANYGKGLRKDARHEHGDVLVYGSAGVVGHHDEALVNGPVLIIGRKGNAGEVHLSAAPCWPIDTTYYVQPPVGIDERFLAMQLGHLNLGELDSSTAIPSLRRQDLESALVKIPPLPEQRRIVAAIEEHFSRLDAAEASLSGAEARLGHLDAVTLESMVKSAPKVLLSDVSLGMRYGTSVKCSYDSEGPAVMRIPNVSAGELSLDDVKYATESDAVSSSAFANPGEILFVRTNGSSGLIGRSACVPEGPRRAFASYLIGMTVDQVQALPAFINRVMEMPSVRRQLVAAASTSAGQYNLSVGKIGATEVPLPDLAIQGHVLDVMDRYRADMRRQRAMVANGFRRAESLRRAILASAFSGQLVPQDPSDEPAAALLERVAAERATAKPTRKKKAAS